jgi:SAM-dependent methyltransferase
MTVFNAYAHYYDLLYQDKDYGSESQHVHETLQKHAPGTTSILELGCGTCGHAVHLANKGYTLRGIDSSAEMLERAKARVKALPPELSSRISLSQEDIRRFRCESRFGAVIALFHVMSYLQTNEDLEATVNTAKSHLDAGGLFLFDCWYGPAVLTDPPAVRVKRMEDDRTSVLRTVEPQMLANDNLVKVHYEVFVRDKATSQVEVCEETHVMRYLFTPEVEGLLTRAGFQWVTSFEWMTGRQPGVDTWSVCFVAHR